MPYLNIAATIFSPSPIHFCCTAPMRTLMNVAPDSFAMAWVGDSLHTQAGRRAVEYGGADRRKEPAQQPRERGLVCPSNVHLGSRAQLYQNTNIRTLGWYRSLPSEQAQLESPCWNFFSAPLLPRLLLCKYPLLHEGNR